MEPARVLITGAAGQIGYVLAFRIANGDLYKDRKVILHLLEITPAMKALEGVVMELTDGAFPHLAGIVATDDIEVAFRNVDVAFLVGSSPRKEGMDRADLLSKNCVIFKEQGEALSNYAKRSVKVLVVGNPANTNCLIAQRYAPNLKPENFSAMTRLDHNRMLGELADKLHVSPDMIHKVTVWGNHSNTQVPDISHAEYDTPRGKLRVDSSLDNNYLQGEFVDKIANRGGAVIKARGASSAASAANAALCHMHDWLHGTKPGDWVSMAIPVPANNPYNIKPGVVFSFPVTISASGEVSIVPGLTINDFVRRKLEATEKELLSERDTAFKFLGLN